MKLELELNKRKCRNQLILTSIEGRVKTMMAPFIIITTLWRKKCVGKELTIIKVKDTQTENDKIAMNKWSTNVVIKKNIFKKRIVKKMSYALVWRKSKRQRGLLLMFGIYEACMPLNAGRMTEQLTTTSRYSSAFSSFVSGDSSS